MSNGTAHVESAWLTGVFNSLRDFRSGGDDGDLERLRDELSALAWSDHAPRACQLAAGENRFRRHPIARVDALGCSALLMYWPAGHASLPHDHGGLWGIEVVLDGQLDVEEFIRQGSPESPILERSRALRLKVGDSAVFAGERYVHRCRNLSNVEPTLTLHAYGGHLARYTAFHGDQHPLRPQLHDAISDETLSF